MSFGQSFRVAAILGAVASGGCASQGTDTGNASCAFEPCAYRARATTPDGLRWRGYIAGAGIHASTVDESGGRCVGTGGGLDVPLLFASPATVWKDASGNLRATWSKGTPYDVVSQAHAYWQGDITANVVATDLTLSPDGHLTATVTVDQWLVAQPPAPDAAHDAASADFDAGINVEAGVGAAQKITVEGPLDFSFFGACQPDGATALVQMTDGTTMAFPCNATWSDPAVVVVPVKPCNDLR
jgi:hypothetical protein